MINDKLELAKNMLVEKQYIQAIDILESLLQTNKNNNDIRIELAKAYFFFKNFDKSKLLFTELLDTNFSLYASLFLAKIEIQNKNLSEALDILLKEKKKFYNIELLFEIAHIYEILKDIDNILCTYEEILKLDPTNNEVKLKMFKIYRVDEDNAKKAFILAQELLKEDKNLSLKNRNTLLNFVEYMTGQTVLKSYPQVLFVAISSRCNLNCIMCNSNIFSWDLSKKLEDEIISLLPYLQDITWYGGEPLLYKNIEKLLYLAHKNDVKQVLITNGILLNERIIDRLIEYNVITLISIDAPNKELYEKIRVGADFDKLINNLTILKNKINNKIFELNLNCVVMEENYKNLEQVIEFANKFSFKRIHFLVLNDNYDYKPEILDYLSNKMETYYKLAKKYNIIIESPLFEFISRKKEESVVNIKEDFCKIPWLSFNIFFSGEAKFSCICDLFSSSELYNNKSILDIWNSKEAIEARKIILENKMKYYCKKECLNGLYFKEYRSYYKKI